MNGSYKQIYSDAIRTVTNLKYNQGPASANHKQAFIPAVRCKAPPNTGRGLSAPIRQPISNSNLIQHYATFLTVSSSSLKMTFMRYLIILLSATVVTFCSSCKKNTSNFNTIYECNTRQHLDSAAIIQKLAGNWVWSKFICGDGAGKVANADKTVKATFNTNGTFTIIENAVIVTQGTWGINIVDAGAYGLHLSQPSIYLYGRILFCDNQVLFNDTYVDGCDYLFTKSN